jgi:hypothetical protein
VLNDALSIYFADATLASAFVARWCVAARVKTTGGVFQVCESAPKRDPGQNSSKSLKSSAKTLEVGVPIGADRDPTRNKISFNVSRS